MQDLLQDPLLIVIIVLLVDPDHVPLPLEPGDLALGKMPGVPLDPVDRFLQLQSPSR